MPPEGTVTALINPGKRRDRKADADEDVHAVAVQQFRHVFGADRGGAVLQDRGVVDEHVLREVEAAVGEGRQFGPEPEAGEAAHEVGMEEASLDSRVREEPEGVRIIPVGIVGSSGDRADRRTEGCAAAAWVQ